MSRRGFLRLLLCVMLLSCAGLAQAHKFGDQPLTDVLLAAQQNNRCSALLTTNKLAALMLAVTWPEVTGNLTTLTPSPMTLSRADGQQRLYYGEAINGPYRRAFWHPGIGAWQLDDIGVGSRMAQEKFSTATASARTAIEISTRYCQTPTLKFALAPWVACVRTPGICQTIFDEIYQAPDTLHHLDRDPLTTRLGGTIERTCTLPGTTTSFPCSYVNYNNAQGWKGTWVYAFNATPPLSWPFYVYKYRTGTSDYECRHWLREDTQYGVDIAACRPYGINSRDSLQWTQSGLCDLTAGRGTCSGFGLTVTRAGTGSGTVTSNPVGINCGSDCGESYPNGTNVTLTASPQSGSTFTGWSGCTTMNGNLCSVTMNAVRNVTATFSPATTSVSLVVQKIGTGSGTVTSNPAGINCGADCSENYNSGATVVLTASPAAGSTFGGWTGCTSTSGSTCTMAMTASRAVTAAFAATATGVSLGVQKGGSGAGTVTSNPAGINCGADCTETYGVGTNVTLTAAPAAGSVFTSWSGCTSTSGSTCTVAMTVSRTVTATFSPSSVGSNQLLANPGFESGNVSWTASNVDIINTSALRPARSGSWKAWLNGYGTARTDQLLQQVAIPANATTATLTFWIRIDTAEVTTSIQYDKLSVQVLSTSNALLQTLVVYSNLDRNSAYVQKSFALAAYKGQTIRLLFLGTEDYSLQTSFVIDDTALTIATGSVTTYPLQVAKNGGGAGLVTSSPSGIACGVDCSESYASGTSVTLTALPDGGSTFAGWSGCASTNGNSCVVSMTGSRSVTATFQPPVVTTYPLQVFRGGSGSGTVTSSPAGIQCGNDCTESYTAGANVTLTALPSAGSTFTSWSGCSSTSGSTCFVSMTGNRSITATFNAQPQQPIERIVNGSFSSGRTSWMLTGDFWAGTNLLNYRSSPGYAAGGVNSSGLPKNYAVGSMYQSFRVPANATSAMLTLWVNVTSEEVSTLIAFDYLNVTLQDEFGSYLTGICSFTNRNMRSSSRDYSQCALNLLPYTGRNLRIQFLATSDASLPTTFRIDDVSVMANGN